MSPSTFHRYLVIVRQPPGVSFCALKAIWSVVILVKSLRRSETAADTAAKRSRTSSSRLEGMVLRFTCLRRNKPSISSTLTHVYVHFLTSTNHTNTQSYKKNPTYASICGKILHFFLFLSYFYTFSFMNRLPTPAIGIMICSGRYRKLIVFVSRSSPAHRSVNISKCLPLSGSRQQNSHYQSSLIGFLIGIRQS